MGLLIYCLLNFHLRRSFCETHNTMSIVALGIQLGELEVFMLKLKLWTCVVLASLSVSCNNNDTPPTVVDTTVPTLSITSPVSDSILTETEIAVIGKIGDDVGITRMTYQINGAAEQEINISQNLKITSGANADFNAAINVQEGENSITINAYDGSGNKISREIKVITYKAATNSIKFAGVVTSSNGGAPVVGSQIRVEGNNARARTDARGRFELKLSPGNYNLDLQKNGYAGSRIEGLVIDATTPNNLPFAIIQKVPFATTLSIKPPMANIKALVGADEKDFSNDVNAPTEFNATDGISFAYKVSASDPALSPDLVYFSVGSTPGSGLLTNPRLVVTNDPQNTVTTGSGSLKGDNLRGLRGITYLNVVVYDFNENRLHKMIPISLLDNVPSTTPIGSLKNLKALAVTLAQKLNANSAIGASIRPQGTDTEESTMWVDLTWEYTAGLSDNPLGYRIWTSEDGAAFKLLRTLPGSALLARDASPTLEPEKKVYYYIEAFNSTTTVQSKVTSTTPLNSFVTTLIGPGNRSNNISVKPELKWSVDRKVGDYRKFFVMINDYPSQNRNCFWGLALCGDITEEANNVYTDDGVTPALKMSDAGYSVMFNENGKAFQPALETYHSYSFDVAAAAFARDGSAVSISQDYYGIFYTLDTCNFGGPVCQGDYNTFSTGDGSN